MYFCSLLCYYICVMMKNKRKFRLHPIENFLQKSRFEFTRDDLIKYAVENDIEMLNFRYAAEDGRLKTLNFVIHDIDYLESILTTGERVDGSSLFPFIEAGSSDLYTIPRYNTAYINPFEDVPTMEMFCSFYNNEGQPLASSPEYILKKAHAALKKDFGFTFKALYELEYYIIADKEHNLSFHATDQKGYHESFPFTKFEFIRTEAMRMIASCGGRIKYGHSEVGNFTDDKNYYEQQEIEFLPVDAEDAVEQAILAKWILRRLCNAYDLNISFAPKITVGKAGSGLHCHMKLEKDDQNMMEENGKLSDTAKQLIVGVLDVADALTAFGNTVPTSYLRLVPHQEAPTNICWGDRNRSVLVRVPLGWQGSLGMINDANPQDESPAKQYTDKQTVEIRSGDGSADLYLYMAALIVATRHGLQMQNALEMANKLYVNVNIFKDENKELLNSLNALPDSCYASAEALKAKRALFEVDGIFPPGLIDSQIKKLQSYEDKNLSEELYGKNDQIALYVEKYLHTM